MVEGASGGVGLVRFGRFREDCTKAECCVGLKNRTVPYVPQYNLRIQKTQVWTIENRHA